MKTKKQNRREKQAKAEKQIKEMLLFRGVKHLFDETVANLEKQGETVLSSHLKKHCHFDLEKCKMSYDGKGFTKVSQTEDKIEYTFEP